jgi:hypothetical protein
MTSATRFSVRRGGFVYWGDDREKHRVRVNPETVEKLLRKLDSIPAGNREATAQRLIRNLRIPKKAVIEAWMGWKWVRTETIIRKL